MLVEMETWFRDLCYKSTCNYFRDVEIYKVLDKTNSPYNLELSAALSLLHYLNMAGFSGYLNAKCAP